MATLVLTAVGSAVGGPLGSAIGAFVGQQIDRALIGNGPRREGPRLKELEVQTSSYGTAIPQIFGAMRVAGTVIWASDLIEKRSTTGASKSQPGTATYSYSVNLAVALSSRPIARLGRIWADGNLLRGTSGDLKFDTQLRIYHGEQDQAVDSMLSSSEAIGHSPAYRGLAYVVFEELQLAEFGNRIPSLTFEIFERETPVPLHAILGAVSNNLISGTTSEMLDGYAVQGQNARAALAPLLELFPVTVFPVADGLAAKGWFDGTVTTELGPAISAFNSKSTERPEMARLAQSKSGTSIALRYYEKERDFQAGLQRQGMPTHNQIEQQFELPACLRAAQAQRLASLNWRQQTRSKSRSSTIIAYSALPPATGNNVVGAREKITEIEYLKGGLRVSARGWVDTDSFVGENNDPGRDISAPDLKIGQTLLHIVDLPAIAAPTPSQPRIGIIASGKDEGWRKAALAYRDGISLRELGRTAPAGMIGWLQSPIAWHPSHLIDDKNVVQLYVLHQAMEFPSGYGDPLHPDAPVVHLGGEFIKYGACERVGSMEFRFTKLVRGCFGTRVAASLSGASLCLLEEATIRRIDDLGLAVDSTASFEAFGIGDVSPVVATINSVGLAVRPLPPCHLKLSLDQITGISASWVRRSRLDAGWSDYVDLAPDEPEIAFGVSIKHNGILLAAFDVQDEFIEISPATISSWGLPAGAPLTVEIRQRGAYSISPAASETLVL